MQRHRGQLLKDSPRQHRVALVLETTTTFGRRLLLGIARFIHEQHVQWDVHLELGDANDAPGLGRWAGDGIIAMVKTPAVAKAVSRLDVPKVLAGAVPPVVGHKRPVAIFPWSVNVGAVAFNHFVERGFVHLAFCSMPGGQSWGREAEFAGAAAAAGAKWHTHTPRTGGSEREQEASLKKWLIALPKPVGILAANDTQGYAVVRACRADGISVPDEVAVLGTDNDELLCALCVPNLSSIEMHFQQSGYLAAELLQAMMSDPHYVHPPDPAPLDLTPEVITRASTDVMAMDDDEVKAAIAYIRDHATDPISVKQVVNHMEMCSRTLERRFHQRVGRNLSDEIRRVKIERAKGLLAKTDLKMAEIARRSGFANAQRLTEAFGRVVQRTPAVYRRETRATR